MVELTIGKAAKEADVNVETIRYYQREGLLETPAIKISGHRVYGNREIERIKFIKNAKALGFTLKEIKEIIDIADRKPSNSRRINELASQKIADIKTKIELLQKMKSELEKALSTCDGSMPVEECPIYNSIKESE